jgi:hypothetical protein
MKSPNVRLWLVVGCGALVVSNIACGSDSGDKADGGGGRGGSDAAVTHRLFDTFTTANSLSGYALNDYPDTTTYNLAGKYTTDGGAAAATDADTDARDTEAGDADGGAADGGGPIAPPPTLEWDGTDGSPDLGALKVTATFTNYRQYVDVIKQISPALDLTGRVLKAQVKLVSSTPASFPGGVQFHASAGPAYTYYGVAGLSFGAPGAWSPIRLDLGTSSASFDPTMIVQLGVQVYAGDPPQGMTTLAAPITIVFEIDTITD